MADINIPGLGAAGTLTDADLLEIYQPSEAASTRNRKLTFALLRAFTRKRVVSALSNVAGAVTVDCSLGEKFTLTLGANVTTLSLTNLMGAGFATEIEIEIKQDATGGRTFALPAAFKALGGSDTSIASAANAVTVLSAVTFDNGTNWRYAMQEGG